jgi:prepilin-type N-terminal cleavage/methylation domain-containing protein
MKAHLIPKFKGRGGFTLVEMLLVIAIIAILAALLAPAAQSLMGITGRRGGMNSLSSALEQARLRAVEKQRDVYVGFPLTATNPETRFSSVLVFDGPTNLAPVGRWIRFPSGVYYEPEGGCLSTNLPRFFAGIPPKALPLLEGEELNSLYAVGFDRFGRMKSQDAVRIRVGEKPKPDGDFIRATDNFFELTIQPLTGRVTMEDKSAK